MARGVSNVGGNSTGARKARKYKRNASGQFGSGPGKPSKPRTGRKPHQSKGGPSATAFGSSKTAGHQDRGFNRKERKARAGTVKRNARAAGYSRGQASALASFSRAEDKGRVVVAGDGRVYRVGGGRKARKAVAAAHRNHQLKKKR